MGSLRETNEWQKIFDSSAAGDPGVWLTTVSLAGEHFSEPTGPYVLAGVFANANERFLWPSFTAPEGT